MGPAIAVICSLGFVVFFATLIGAVILRAACWLNNTMVGGAKSESGVPEPGLGRAMGIVLVTLLVNGGVGFGVGFLMGASLLQSGMSPLTMQVIVTLIGVPIGFVVMSAMLTAMLPTTFGRAAIVTLLNYVVSIVVFGGALLLVALVFGTALFVSK